MAGIRDFLFRRVRSDNGSVFNRVISVECSFYVLRRMYCLDHV